MLRVTAKQQLMREIVELLSVLTEEAKLLWNEKGLHVTVVDGSHVALLSATIADECFETYEVEKVEIGLELGFKVVESGPLVRSSYHADEQSDRFSAEKQTAAIA